MNRILTSQPTTIFTVMSALATEHGAINLGQGFPDSEGPEEVRRAAADAAMNGPNQYPPMRGLAELRSAVAAHYDRFYGLSFDPDAEVIVTSGATEALAACFLGLIEEGDEVVLFQPLYDSYLPMVQRAGGVGRLIRQTPPDFRVTPELLEEACSEKTKLIVFNSPQNPVSRVHDRSELEAIAEICTRYDIIAVCDEVWEHVIFDGRAHVPLMTLPGMRERTVKIGSAGKIFSLTGWKVGWCCAAPPLAEAVAKAHQFLCFTTPPNLQVAVAKGLALPDNYFHAMRAAFGRSRDRLAAGLTELGWRVLPAEGSYFLTVDLAASGIAMDDDVFCRRLTTELGVAAIPVSAFYAEDPVKSVVRLCFAKKDETLDVALERLARVRDAAFA